MACWLPEMWFIQKKCVALWLSQGHTDRSKDVQWKAWCAFHVTASIFKSPDQRFESFNFETSMYEESKVEKKFLYVNIPMLTLPPKHVLFFTKVYLGAIFVILQILEALKQKHPHLLALKHTWLIAFSCKDRDFTCHTMISPWNMHF